MAELNVEQIDNGVIITKRDDNWNTSYKAVLQGITLGDVEAKLGELGDLKFKDQEKQAQLARMQKIGLIAAAGG